MRLHVVPAVVALSSFLLPNNVDALAADAKPQAAKTITETRNELGQIIYSISASHFDISPPLREMAAAAVSVQSTEEKSRTNPRPPASRILRSDLPDPVVQVVPSPERISLQSGVTSAAPTTGFNFAGAGTEGRYPSDSNGSVGGNQFFETVNTQIQVWSLNRATQTATSVLGPAPLNSLWSGFGGPCEVQITYDPVVVYDKTAKRWVISRPSGDGSSEVVCMAVSTTQDATGSYARYAFPMPGSLFADYPHFGVWPPAAYFMSVHAFSPYQAMFAAADRTKMLAANPTATWVVYLAPVAEPFMDDFGHMPADLDGFALPPTLAPGIFASLHDDGIHIYRVKVSFTGSGSISRTLQAVVPIAPMSMACGGGACIPQPGFPTMLDARSSGLMFRAAYRNFIDHESLVLTHAVDPSVSGVGSGVRWYDIRLSGNPDATCPAYPCMYQQGTIADVPNGRSRWTSSAAMDSAENILLGYSASGTADGTDNHSIRYTGRAKTDPPGTMTAPEAIIVTGTGNSDTPYGAWGDYSSMGTDPSDDCTFWYVNQYYSAFNVLATQIASAAFPSGSGAGQCLASTCNTRPATQPATGTPTVPGNNQITVSWTGVVPAPGAYTIERAEGTCGVEGLYRPLAAVAGTITTFTDTTVQGGVKYAYRVRTAADAAGRCQAQLAGACVNATATGTCNTKPTFAGATAASSAQQSNCGMTISWTPGVSGCPLSQTVRYNVFRGTVPDFVPSPANRIATCISGSSYVDTDNLSSGTTYYYVVRAEDGSSGNGGECGGNEESNVVRVSGTPYASGSQLAAGSWSDGGGDGTSLLRLNATEDGDIPHAAWRVVSTANDPGANHTPGGAYAYRNAGPSGASLYAPVMCAEMQTPPLTAAGSSVNLNYWERHQLQYQVDGVAVEYSVNGGAWTDAPAPSNSPADGCDPGDSTSDWEALGCPGDNGNVCGYSPTKLAFTGPSGGGSSCPDFTTSPAVTAYAHRCQRIAGLNAFDTIRFRWRFAADSAANYGGFYLDDVAVGNVKLPNACVPNTCVGQPNGTPCNDGNNCSINDACSAGACAGTPIVDLAAQQNLRVQADKTSYYWDPTPNAQRYDVIRGALSALPVGPGGEDETCFDDLATPLLSDAALPAPNTGFWYVSRAEYTCGPGSSGQRSDGSERVTATCP